MKTALLILLAIAICFAVYAATDSRNGVWTAELNTDGTTLQMTIFRGNHESRSGIHRGGWNNTMGFELSLASITGLSIADIKSTAANVQFTMTRPAGTIQFRRPLRERQRRRQFQVRPQRAVRARDGHARLHRLQG